MFSVWSDGVDQGNSSFSQFFESAEESRYSCRESNHDCLVVQLVTDATCQWISPPTLYTRPLFYAYVPEQVGVNQKHINQKYFRKKYRNRRGLALMERIQPNGVNAEMRERKLKKCILATVIKSLITSGS